MTLLPVNPRFAESFILSLSDMNLADTLRINRGQRQQQRQRPPRSQLYQQGSGDQVLMQPLRRWDDALLFAFVLSAYNRSTSLQRVTFTTKIKFPRTLNRRCFIVGAAVFPLLHSESQFNNGSQSFYRKLIFQGGTWGSLPLFFHMVLIILLCFFERFFSHLLWEQMVMRIWFC